ncbi:hypothetical protein NPIL_358791 [Nephila pilipes]|uniref:Uncharacterized protein n=1 Tax=Nephila pilipes TaxID=299642 RepID=A0A8X6QQ27_NEPPI|nr:hypothetical protein NPIL_358791 [Nephila pilipes]
MVLPHDSIIIQGNLLRQLSPQDWLDVFKRIMIEPFPTHTKSFCLSIMSAEQFEEVIKNEALPVFIALWNWPYPMQFQEMTERIFSLLSEKEFL